MSIEKFINNIVDEIQKNINDTKIYQVSFHVLLLDLFTKIIIIVNYYYPKQTEEIKKSIIIFKIIEKYFPDKKMYIQTHGDIIVDLLLDFQKSYPTSTSCLPCLNFFK